MKLLSQLHTWSYKIRWYHLLNISCSYQEDKSFLCLRRNLSLSIHRTYQQNPVDWRLSSSHLEENHLHAIAINLLSLRSVNVIEPYERRQLCRSNQTNWRTHFSCVGFCIRLSVCLWKDFAKYARICVGDSWLNTALKSNRMFCENTAEVQKTIFRKQCWSTAKCFPKTVLKYSRIFSENSAEVQ